MSHETELIKEAAQEASKRARRIGKEKNYQFIEFEDGILYRMVRGKKQVIQEIAGYQKEKQAMLEDPRIAW